MHDSSEILKSEPSHGAPCKVRMLKKKQLVSKAEQSAPEVEMHTLVPLKAMCSKKCAAPLFLLVS